MKKIARFLFFTVLSVLIPVYFNAILGVFVVKFGLPWVFSTFLIRVIVIFLFAIALKALFGLFTKTAKLKLIVVLLIAILPGFGISFISPIYSTDYGLFNDNSKLNNQAIVDSYFNPEVVQSSNHKLYIFLTTTCPFCMAASEKLSINLDNGQKTPVFAIFPGNGGDTETFLNTYTNGKFNYAEMNNDSLFLALSGGVFPSIFLTNQNGETEYHWTGDEMNYSALDYLLSLEQ